MGRLFDHHLQVAADPAVAGCVALARYGEHHALAHTCGDLDLHDFGAFDRPLAVAFVARIGDDAARAAASGTHALRLHPPEKRILDARYVARAAASRTGRIGTGILGA